MRLSVSKSRMAVAIAVLLCAICAGVLAADSPNLDWPMWRYDAGRTASSPHGLADRLHLQWVRQYPPRQTCWQDPINQKRMPFDRAFEPIVLGKTLFLPFNDTDKLVALDTKTGVERWRFYADAPMRMPAVAGEGRIHFVSDDGCLYSLDAETGKLLWRVRGGPANRWVLGNRRLVSSWPARGGPVLVEGKVYWAASIWPFMGTFIRCTDAVTSKTRWINDGNGARYTMQPHTSPAFGGVAPQGALVSLGDQLFVPGGRSVPACFDRKTGKLLFYHLARNGKSGGSSVAAAANCFVNGETLFNAATGRYIGSADVGGVLTDKVFYHRGNPVRAFSPRIDDATVIVRRTTYQTRTTVTYFSRMKNGKREDVKKVSIVRLYDETTTTTTPGEEPIVKREKWADERGSYVDTLDPDEQPSRKPKVSYKEPWTWAYTRRLVKPIWEIEAAGSLAMIKAGKRLYCADAGSISAIRLPEPGGKPKLEWVKTVDGSVATLLAADGKLFAVTLEGRIYCFGPEKIETPKHFPPPPPTPPTPDKQTVAEAVQIIQAAQLDAGYSLLFGAGDGRLISALAAATKLHIVAIEPDAAKAERLRRQFDAVGLYGKRIHIIIGDPATIELPPYMANAVIVTSTPPTPSAGFVKAVFHPLRPYGGAAVFRISDVQHAVLAKAVAEAKLEKAELRRVGDMSLLTRVGALPNAGVWTHQNADAGNSRVSRDARVRSPLGLLWFGGSSHESILPRHGHGPTQQVIGGRLFIEGLDLLRAIDVYTGRIIWEAALPDLGKMFNTTRHQSGANATGGNYVSTLDTIYVAYRNGCLLLDPATGKKKNEFKLPPPAGKAKAPAWSYINVLGDYLIAGSEAPEFDAKNLPDRLRYKMCHLNYSSTHSMRLTVLNRHSGKVIWSTTAKFGFRHNAIAAGNGKLFCIDRLSRVAILALMRAGKLPDVLPSLTAYDLKTGRVAWSETDKVFGTWLGYSRDHDILLQASRPSRDMLGDEYNHDREMATFRAATGEVIWHCDDRSYNGPPLLHGDWILAQESAYNLLTGKQRMSEDSVTGQCYPWKIRRNYGCNTMIASKHLMTFRSAAAGFYDLSTDGGTGNFGGFKSGCTSNLIVADGVLCAPDYTRTCTCSYSNQTSLALVHWPKGEIWTDLKIESNPIAANFGAPGGRRDGDGAAWAPWPKLQLNPPNVKNPRYCAPVEITINRGSHFQIWTRHQSAFSAPAGQLGRSWIASSGIRGVTGIQVKLPGKKRTKYTVHLHFAEPNNLPAGRRVFDIIIAGKTVLKDFDVVKAAGGPRRAIVQTFANIEAAGFIAIEFKPKDDKLAAEVPILSGLKIELSD